MSDLSQGLLIDEQGQAINSLEFAAPSINAPIDHLVTEYRTKRADIERVAAYVYGECEVINYFMTGNMVEHGGGYISARHLFELEPAIHALDAAFWSRAMALTDVLDAMPAEKRNQWTEQIRSHKTPAFDADTVKATLSELLAQRQQFLAERVDGLFRALSDVHLTNQPQGFGKRMIVSRMLDGYGHTNSQVTPYLHDLRSVIAKFMGRGEPPHHLTYENVDMLRREQNFGEWVSFDGGAFKLRIYKKGTAHLEIHPEMAVRLNQILAWKNPMAIPSQFRTKRPLPSKEYPLDQDLVSFEVVGALRAGRVSKQGQEVWFMPDATIPKGVGDVLIYLGGVPSSARTWQFDYDVTEALTHLQRTGQVPEQKSHQFYPTPAHLALQAVALADIRPSHRKLEPSAGLGALAQQMGADNLTCVEVSALHCKALQGMGFNTVQADFLAWETSQRFDRIVMNPPFAGGRALAHLRKAASLLATGGRLVAILPGSLRGQPLIEGMHHEWGSASAGDFTGTGVVTAILVLSPE